MSNQAERGVYVPAATSAQIAGAPRPGTVLSAAGLLAALASSCCLLPFLFVSLGVSGAWIGNLTALAPYQPIFFSLAAILIGAGFLRVYRRPKMVACVPGSACADPRADGITKAALWGAAILAVAGMAVPWIVGLMIHVWTAPLGKGFRWCVAEGSGSFMCTACCARPQAAGHDEVGGSGPYQTAAL